MNISNINNFFSFKGAIININALSDTHGHIEYADKAYQTMISEGAFIKEDKGCVNYLITGGDWFISGDRKGYKSAPKKTLMDFQLDIYNKFIDAIKDRYPNLKSIFILGNHEFDGGADILKNALSRLKSKIIVSNLDTKKSELLKDDIANGHIVESTIDFVPDDKKENVSYPVLNLGISPVNMKYYNKELSGIEFTENVFKSQITVEPEDYKETTKRIHSKITDFKKKYPNGIVILTSHTGVNFAEKIAELGGVDIIFNAHEHKRNIKELNRTPIVNLSQNFDKIVNAKIIIDDNGNKQKVELKEFFPKEAEIQQSSDIGNLYNELHKEDSKRIYTVSSTDKSIKELGVANIRKGNSNLANFVTDIILSQVQKKNPQIDIVAINASAIRGGFSVGDKPNTSNAEVLNCLSGINTSQAELYQTEVSGEELARIVMDNFLFNDIAPEKNPLIHYSGLSIDRTNMMKDYYNGKDYKYLCKYLKTDKKGESVKPDSIYKIVNPIKYFKKAHSQWISDMLFHSKSLNCNMIDLFNEYFNSHNEIVFEPKIRIY